MREVAMLAVGRFGLKSRQPLRGRKLHELDQKLEQHGDARHAAADNHGQREPLAPKRVSDLLQGRKVANQGAEFGKVEPGGKGERRAKKPLLSILDDCDQR